MMFYSCSFPLCSSLYFLLWLFLSMLFLLCLFLSWNFLLSETTVFLDWEFLNIWGQIFSFPMLIDFMSLMFFCLIFLISSSIILYSKNYMNSDPYKNRFIMIMMFFITSMILFILSPSLVSMILGWDGLGLVSYCLVIHYQNNLSNNSGMVTLLSNRIGDCFLIISICYMMKFYSWNYMNLLNILDMNLIFLIIFISITKSAQFPFSAWLPAAMAAPTPVSSLVHSSTLVTAGVYLMIRFSNFIFKSKLCLDFVVILGLLTTFMAGVSANLEMDMKKIIALSTLSQLGIMMSSLILCNKMLTFFHLVMHALFKALMFMCAGNFIHLNFNSQSLQTYGKQMFISPFSVSLFCVANLSLCGTPFLCGFFSKDMILELVFMNLMTLTMFFMFLIGTFLTVLYTFRLINNLIIFSVNSPSKVVTFDNSFITNYSMMILFFSSIFSGFLFTENLLKPFNLIILPMNLKMLVLVTCFSGLMFMMFIMKFFKLIKFNLFTFSMLEFFNSMALLVFLTKKEFSPLFMGLSKLSGKFYSNGWIEMFYGLKNFDMLFFMLKNIDKNLIFQSSKTPMVMFLMILMFMIFI